MGNIEEIHALSGIQNVLQDFFGEIENKLDEMSELIGRMPECKESGELREKIQEIRDMMTEANKIDSRDYDPEA